MERYPMSGLKDLILFRRQSSPKLIYTVSVIPDKALGGFFADMDRLVLKCIWKFKRPKIAKIIL